MRHATRNRFDTERFSNVRDDLMAGIKDANFHGFERMDIIGKSYSNRVPSGATCAELVFNHPLAKCLVRN